MVTHKNDTYAWENTQISFLKQNWKYICINYFKYVPFVYIYAFISLQLYMCVCVRAHVSICNYFSFFRRKTKNTYLITKKKNKIFSHSSHNGENIWILLTRKKKKIMYTYDNKWNDLIFKQKSNEPWTNRWTIFFFQNSNHLKKQK